MSHQTTCRKGCAANDDEAIASQRRRPDERGQTPAPAIREKRSDGKKRQRSRFSGIRAGIVGTHLLPWGCHTIMDLVLAVLPVETAATLATMGATAERAAMLIGLFVCGNKRVRVGMKIWRL